MINRLFMILPILAFLGALYTSTAFAACVAVPVTATAEAGGKLDPSTPSPANTCTDDRAKFKFNANSGYYVSGISGCGGAPYTNTLPSVKFQTYSTAKITAACAVTASFAVVPAGDTSLPQTGQNKCYDAAGALIDCTWTGQDGDIKAGTFWPRPRFTDNSDGTITDNLTGLIWLKNANCQSILGGIVKIHGPLTWTDSLTWVNKLASKSCGLTDKSAAGAWRLPNINELESLTHLQNANPALSTLHPFSNIQANNYWSSSTYAGGTGGAWAINMAVGNILGSSKTNLFYVLPVRDPATPITASVNVPATGQTGCWDEGGIAVDCTTTGKGQDGNLKKGTTWLEPRFSDNGDDTMTDTLTGLVWTIDGNPTPATTWEDALNYISTLGGDWRLPNRKELMSLVNRQQANNADWLNDPAQGFGYVQPNNYWTSSSSANHTKDAWYVNMNSGNLFSVSKDSIAYVWPVSGGTRGIPVISVTPASNHFRNVITNNTSSKEFTITNDDGGGSSTAEILVSSITLTGSSIGMFTLNTGTGDGVDGTCGTTPIIPPGGSCTVSASFTPTSVGTKETTLRIASSDPAMPIKDVKLSGIGVLYNINTVVTGGNGGISCTLATAYGKKSVCTITPSAGYHLATLTDNGLDMLASVAANRYIIPSVAEDHTITGSFTINDSAVNPIIINNGDTSTTNPLVNLTLAYQTTPNHPATQMQFLIDNAPAWTKWAPFASSKTVKLSATPGNKTISVRFKDAQGSESPIYSAFIFLDTVKPTGWLLINNGASVTGSATVNLTMGSDIIGVTQMCIKETSADCIASDFESYATSKANYAFKNQKDGAKTLYIRFKDSTEKVSKPVKESIILDTIAPTGSIRINGGNIKTNNTKVSLTFSANKSVYMRLSMDGIAWGEWETFVKSRSIALSSDPGMKSVVVKYKDFAGNESQEYTATIELL